MHKTYRLFISHSWTYNLQACKKKKVFLEKAGLPYQFIEAFPESPEKSGKTKADYIMHIDEKIRDCDCLLILAGAVESDDTWTLEEVSLAKKHSKPIIAIEPWHSSRTLPQLFEQADSVVKWHGKLITDAIKKLGR